MAIGRSIRNGLITILAAATLAGCGTNTNNNPTVQITAPADGSTYTSPASVDINADAIATSGRTITKVKFLEDGTIIGTDTTPADGWTYNLTGIQDGTHTLGAQATDNTGAQSLEDTINITVHGPTGTTPTEYATQKGLDSQISVTPMDKWGDVTKADKKIIDFFVSKQTTDFFKNHSGVSFANNAIIKFDNRDGYLMDAVNATISYYNQEESAGVTPTVPNIQALQWPLPSDTMPPDSESDPSVTGHPASKILYAINYLDWNANNTSSSTYTPKTFFTFVDPTLTSCNYATEYGKHNTSYSFNLIDSAIQSLYGGNLPVKPFAYGGNLTVTDIVENTYAGVPNISLNIHYIPDQDLMQGEFDLGYTHILGKNNDSNVTDLPFQVGSHPDENSILAYIATNSTNAGTDQFDFMITTTTPGFSGVRIDNETFIRTDNFYINPNVDARHRALFNIAKWYHTMTLKRLNNFQTCALDSNGNPLPHE